MAHSSVLYTKLPRDPEEDTQRARAAREPSDDEEGEDEAVTVYLRQLSDGQNGKDMKKETWIRVTVALVLLGVIFVCLLYEWNGWWSDPEGLESGLNKDTQTLEDPQNHQEHKGDEVAGHEVRDDHHSTDRLSHEHASLYHHGVVLTSSVDCSRLGRELLQDGGNVVDAAIASLLCLGVVHPHTVGVGGMFSAILYNHTTGLFKSSRSNAPQLPSAPYGVPSLLQGVRALHSRYGQSEWSRLFREAIVLAKEGFLIDDVLGKALETHEDKILHSELCDVFCDMNGRVKSAGVLVSNQNLSELLRVASLNESHFPETLAMKLAEDLSAREGPAFLAALQRSHGEINDSLIAQGEKYTVLSAGSPFASPMLSDILERVREQSLSFENGVEDFNGAATSFSSLLNLTQGLNDTALAEMNSKLVELFALSTRSSHIGVLDRQGNFIIMSASLNNTWGSGRFLPSSGVILSSFVSDSSDLPYFNYPLVLKTGSDGDNEEDESEVVVIATTGGLSALFNAAILFQRVHCGMASSDAISSPLLHVQEGISTAMTICLSSISNNMDVYRLASETDGELQQVDGCSDGSLSMLLRLHAEHVSAYGAPSTDGHTDGY
ncbi:glutathione hydrolase 6-like [Hoplias malabaricus]|uniref:glutathione hydrolase 6-like n=1 Tax=Hoplias malabaricus TaxID=27720 RepID=UPI0034630CCF